MQKKAIDFIKQTEECFILIGDFTSFFDSLDHGYLKKDALQFIECKQITEWLLRSIQKYYKVLCLGYGKPTVDK